jgi:hypothetical protein
MLTNVAIAILAILGLITLILLWNKGDPPT